MGYDFRGLGTKTTPPLKKSIESFTFNGVNIETEIPEFRTISVEGRESYSRGIVSTDNGSDGNFFLKSSLEKNVVNVTFFMIAKNTDSFNSAFTRLKYLLQGDEKEFFFEDEPEFTRVGTVTKLTNSEPGSLSVKGTIEIVMSNPYRHGQTKTINGSNIVMINDPQLLYDQNVDTITITVSESTNNIVLTIGNDYQMSLNGSFQKGSSVVLNINERTLTSNGVSVLNTIDITRTNIFEAKIKKGVQVRCQQAAETTVKYRVKML